MQCLDEVFSSLFLYRPVAHLFSGHLFHDPCDRLQMIPHDLPALLQQAFLQNTLPVISNNPRFVVKTSPQFLKTLRIPQQLLPAQHGYLCT